MAVRIGSARIDERGKITGGKAGDQTKNEVSTQNWYLHSKGWRVFRCILSDKAEKIASAMEKACANNRIGYDQNQRNTLYNQISSKGFDPSKATANCETDCSALVRVCCAYAGIRLNDFNTASEASTLLKSGYFDELTGTQYTRKSDYLKRGDILVTKTKGHTIVVLSNGTKANRTAENEKYILGSRILRNGCEGSDVKEMQDYLIQLGYSCGSYGSDGDFGDATEMAVVAFQKAKKLEVDGKYGNNTHSALLKEIEKVADCKKASQVNIIGGNCYVRTEPSTNAVKVGIAYENNKYPYKDQTSEDGWHLIEFAKQSGWISGKYGKLV